MYYLGTCHAQNDKHEYIKNSLISKMKISMGKCKKDVTPVH